MLITPPPLIFPTGIRLYQLGEFHHTTAQGTVSTGTLVPAEAGLMVAICCGGDASSSRAVSGMTFGGTSGTLHRASASNRGFSAIASLAVAAGSMSGVIATHGTADWGSLAVWLLAGLASATPIATAAVGTIATTGNATLNTSNNGVALGASFHHNANPVTWAGLTKIAETITGALSFSWAQKFPSALATPLTVTTSWTSSAEQGTASGSWL
jgi:hypothetical protein